MKNYSIILLIVFSALSLFSQEKNPITIGLKDNHFGKVTSCLLTKDEKNIITSDETGKIVLFDANKFDYVKTIRKSSGIPIHSMRLIKNDSLLLISQKYQYSDGTTDSIIGIRLYDNKIVLKNKESFGFLGNTKKDLSIVNHKLNYGCSIEIIKNNFTPFYTFNSEENIDILEISKDQKKIIYVERDYISQKNILLKDITSGSVLKKIPIKEKIEILHLLLDTTSESFYALCYLEEENKIVIFKSNSNNDAIWNNRVFSFPYKGFSSSTSVTATATNNDQNIVLSNNSLSSNPVIIQKTGDKFSASEVELVVSPNIALQIPSKEEIVFYQNFNPNFSNAVSFNVFNTKTNKVTGEFPNTVKGTTKGYFLPNDNWLVVGEGTNGSVDYVKYFNAGTFNNRYAKLNIEDYVALKHNSSGADVSANYGMLFDRVSGHLIFYGREKDQVLEGKNHYYKYDLINDKVTQLFENQKTISNVLDYNDKTKSLLLSEHKYTYGYSNDSNKIMILNNSKNIELNENYKTAKFCKSGDYVLTINTDDTAEIRNLLNNEVIYSQKLDTGNFDIQIAGDTGFIINNSLKRKSTKNCSSQSIALDIIDNKVTSKVHDCAIISDISVMNDSVALIINNQIISVKDKTLYFDASESPLSVSFNSDATKSMVSFKTGIIKIYDANTLKELGSMIHPDKDSHVFFDSKGNYFSNIDAEKYLFATASNQRISLQKIENEAFKPEKILAIFGKPNEEYAKVLDKALELRNKNTSKPVVETEKKEDKIQNDNLGKPNLYLISIGVSDYKQSNYNLTFADKDAKDMAQIYGKFDTNNTKDYKDKFFGDVYNLYEKKDKVISKIKKYLGNVYKTNGNFYLASAKENNWIEINHDKINLWDFNNQTSDSLVLPKDFELSSISFDQQIYPSPDGTGFTIFGSNNKVFSYSIKNKKISISAIPEKAQSDNVALISKNEWLLFDYENSDNTKIILTYYDIETGKKNKTKELMLSSYKTNEANGITNTETFQNYNLPRLRSVSPKGEYIVFDVNDAVYIIDAKENNPIPVKINIETKIAYGDVLSISEDGKTFCVLKTNLEGISYYSTVYSIDGKLIENLSFIDKDDKIKGFTIYDAKPQWIEMTAPLLDESWTESNDNKLLNTSQPFSFEKVFVSNLVNKEANSKTIKETLSRFFENCKKNDQVMIFLAGHGVLDKKNNYYFAPNDMDFTNVATNGVSFDLLINSLKNAPATNKLLLMDTCHSGNTLDEISTAANTSSGESNSDQRGSTGNATKNQTNFKVSDIVNSLFENFLSTSGVTILSASSGSDVAYENKQLGNGAFTASYIKLLKSKLYSGVVSMSKEDLEKSISLTKEDITELFKEVMSTTNNKQVPDLREINDKSILKMW
jgi:hypothetical protein